MGKKCMHALPCPWSNIAARQPPDVGHECTMHGARTYDVIPSRPGVPGGVGCGSWPHGCVGTAVLGSREREAWACTRRPARSNIQRLLGCKCAGARRRADGHWSVRRAPSRHRINGPGGVGRPSQGSIGQCKRSKDDEGQTPAAPCAGLWRPQVAASAMWCPRADGAPPYLALPRASMDPARSPYAKDGSDIDQDGRSRPRPAGIPTACLVLG